LIKLLWSRSQSYQSQIRILSEARKVLCSGLIAIMNFTSMK